MELKKSTLSSNSPSDLINISEWEKRSKVFGSSPKGVLFKGLPDIFNEHIHNWQLNGILAEIETKSEGINILDVGCGYGRISMPVLERFPQTRITGIDISPNFVDLFQKNTGQNAFVSFAEDIRPDLGLFDYIICVTVLMYIDDASLEKTINKMLGNLKKNGKFLLIEPLSSGTSFQTCFGLLNILHNTDKAASTNTGGRSFPYNSLRTIIENCGAEIVKEYRLPVTTLFFLFIYFFTKLFSVKGRFLLNLISKIDKYFKSAKLPSIYIFYVIEKQQL